MLLEIFGQASQKKLYEIEISQLSEEKTLLELLQEYHLPIASSCFGEGVCMKCVVNGDLISCQINILELKNRKINRILISYL